MPVAMQAGDASVVLRPRRPFDFEVTLRYLSRSRSEPLDVVTDGHYRRAVRLGGRPVLVDVRSLGTVDDPLLAVEVLADHCDGAAVPDHEMAGPTGSTLLNAAKRMIARCFRLDEDPGELDAIAHADPIFGALLARLRGARAVLMPSPFETLIWAVLGQQVNVAFAYTLKRTLVERYGDELEYAGRTYRLFPEPARLAAVPMAELRALQFSRQKAEYVVGLAGQVATGAIDWNGLRDAPTNVAVAALTTHRGIGRWTAEYVCMRGFGHPDVLPAGDLGLRAAIGRAYGLGRTAEEVEVRAIAERWAGRRSHAAFCWWFSLNPGLAS